MAPTADPHMSHSGAGCHNGDSDRAAVQNGGYSRVRHQSTEHTL
jgi:hypothetical protein